MPPRGDIQLAIGYWIVSHRSTLRKWWAIGFMGIIVFSLLWVILFFVLYFTQESKVSAMVLRSIDEAGSFQTATLQPRPLTVGTAEVIVRDDRHVDVVAELTNPNTAWAGSAVDVHFTIDGTALATQHLFVNQDSHRPVISLNASVVDSSKVQAELTIDVTSWARASAAGLPAAKFSVSNAVTTPSTILVNGQSRSVVTVQAEVQNESVYNFYRVEVPIVLVSSNRAVGAGLVTLERWPTLTSRAVSLTLGYAVPTDATIRLEPQVNRFDVGNTYR